MNEKKIVSVTAKPDGAVTKGVTHSGRPGFVLPVFYTLEDGTTIDSSIRTQRKKDLQSSLERSQQIALAGGMFASYEDGKYWGTVQIYTYSGASLGVVAPAAP